MDFQRPTSLSIRPHVIFMILTTLAAFWFTAPVRAQLAVSAPTEAQARQLQAWYEHRMPTRFRVHGKLLIRELNDLQMAAYLRGDEDGSGDAPENISSHAGDDGDGDIDGIFESSPDRIALRLPPSGDLDMFTFAHEYGHFVWFNVFNKDDRRRYELVYKRQLAAHRLVTRYAATDVEEGFAEAFSFYAAEPLLLAQRDTASCQFLSQWSGPGRG